jgi:colicin import membrane protein
MFGKSHEQKASEHAAVALAEAKIAAKERFAEAVEQAHMRDTVVEKAAVAGEKWQHGVDAVVPKVEAAREAVGPKVEAARETFVEDVLPRLAETAAAVAATALAAKESAKLGAEAARENAHHAKDVAAVKAQEWVDQAPPEIVALIPGAEKTPRKGGKLLILLGLAAAGVAVYAVLNSRKAKEDPWATPRYEAPKASSTTGAGSGGSLGSTVEAAKEKAAAAGAAVAAKASEVKDTVAAKAEEVREGSGTDAKGNAEDAVDSVKDAAGDVADEVRGKDAGDKLADAGDSAGDAASDAWTDAKNWAEDKGDDAKKK